jgi:hypothetical protein
VEEEEKEEEEVEGNSEEDNVTDKNEVEAGVVVDVVDCFVDYKLIVELNSSMSFSIPFSTLHSFSSYSSNSIFLIP